MARFKCTVYVGYDACTIMGVCGLQIIPDQTVKFPL
jgi:hypothetical protein